MLLALILLSLFFTMLLFPETVFQGACDGLLLWYQILIPTLFPYLIVTGLLLKTDGAASVLSICSLELLSMEVSPFCPAFYAVIQWAQKSLPTFFFKEKFLLKKLLTCCPSVIMQVHLLLLLFLFQIQFIRKLSAFPLYCFFSEL